MIRTAIVLVASSVITQATTINFASLSQPGSGSTALGNVVTQQGFTFADLLNGGLLLNVMVLTRKRSLIATHFA